LVPWDKGEILIEKSRYKAKKLSFAKPPTKPEFMVELEIAETDIPASHVSNPATAPHHQKSRISEASSQKLSLLKIITDPSEAYVRVNGRLIGVSFGGELNVPRDKGEIVIEKVGFKTKKLSFVAPSNAMALLVKLEAQSLPVTHSLPQKPPQASYVEPEPRIPGASPLTRLFESASSVIEPLRTVWTKLKLADLPSDRNGIVPSAVIGLLVFGVGIILWVVLR
jgi:hypothetical protein